MSLNIFDTMLGRFTALAISVLYFQVSCSQQNGSNILSNLVLNNSVGNQSHGNIIQKSLNQFAANRVLPSNLQQALNSQKAQNSQTQRSQQGANVQQLVNIQTLNSQQPSHLQLVSTQHPNNLQLVTTTQQPSRLQSVHTQQSQTFQSGNAQQPLNLQQTALNIQPSGNVQQSLSLQQPINIQQTSLPNRNSLQQSINSPNPNQNNVQILRQAFDVSSPMQNGQHMVQNCQGINVPSYSTGSPSTTLCINNSGGESVSVMYPQSQQVSVSGVPSYVVDTSRSQMSNTVPATMLYPTAQDNQQQLLTVLGVPQQNQQPIEILQGPVKSVYHNPTETPNQITIIKSVQPHSATPTANHDQNQINALSPVANQASPLSHSAILPAVSSILASSLSKQATKSSNLKALLPLIFNLLKERSTCSCNHHCGCSKSTLNPYENEEDGYRRYPKPPKYGYRKDHSRYYNDYYDDFEEHGRYEKRRNNKKYAKHRTVKPESVEISKEYDYSEEFHEDD